MEEVNGFTMLPSYYEALRPLPDEMRLPLYDAVFDYAFTGKTPEGLSPVLNGYFQLMRPNIDSSIRHYAASVENGKKGGRPPKKPDENPAKTQDEPGKNRDKEKDKDKETEKKTETEKENIPPLIPLQGETGFGPALQKAFEAWIAYKQEKRQGYKPTGLKSLITQIRNNADKYGEQAVADLIERCMASNWQGIIFGILAREQDRGGTRPTQPQSQGQSEKNYDLFGALGGKL